MSKGVGIPKKCNTNRGNPWGRGRGAKVGMGVPRRYQGGAKRNAMGKTISGGEPQKGECPGGHAQGKPRWARGGRQGKKCQGGFSRGSQGGDGKREIEGGYQVGGPEGAMGAHQKGEC